MPKIYDCITFYKENLLANVRFEILNDFVDYFIVCESNFDHSGNKKKLHFKLMNDKFKNKIRYIVLENEFPLPINRWKNEEIQREKIFENLINVNDEDYIMYSDSDEIPNPNIVRNINLKKKIRNISTKILCL